MTAVRGLIFISVWVMFYFSTAEASENKGRVNGHLDFKKIYRSMPLQKDFAKLTNEEAHHSPKVLKKGARLLGQVAQELREKPSRRAEGLGFYKACALEKQFPKSFRAVCYKRAQEISRVLTKKNWTPKSMDPEVRSIRYKI
jgi:hypothetical protein